MTGPILVIDDDQSILDIVTEILGDEGYAVQTAANGAEGLALMRREQPALVLLDMRMPVLDGWGFAQALGTQGLRVPIVVMTAAQDTQRWACEIGAFSALAKPFNVGDLLQVVEGALRAGG